jgi:hypothetical protein
VDVVKAKASNRVTVRIILYEANIYSYAQQGLKVVCNEKEGGREGGKRS